MAPLTVLTTLASILALSASATAQTGTGTGTGLPFSSATVGAPYPISNATLPYGPTGPSSLPGSPIQSGTTCPVPTTVTTTTQVTVTVTLPASSAAAPTAPYPISGSSGLPMGTGTGTGYATPTGFAKRMEMKGLKQERKVRKRGARFW